MTNISNMPTTSACPQCKCEYAYEDRDQFICPECSYSWAVGEAAEEPSSSPQGIVDANGNPLQDGDTVVLIKGLKVKGASPLKVGTKVKNIRLVDGDHNIECKIDGFGAMALKSEFVRKA